MFGIEGTAVGIKPNQGATLEEFWEPRVPYDVNVRLIMEPGFHFVDENLTNYADYACSTDGVNMNTHNQACISKLEFGEPSVSYDGQTVIEMNFNAFNLSRLEMKVEIIQEVEESIWTIRNVALLAGAGGFAGGALALVFFGRRSFSG